MKSIEKIKNVYFLGIGGIGMSALARYFKYTGKNVAGYDRTQTALTDSLQEAVIDVHFEADVITSYSIHYTKLYEKHYTPDLP